MIKKWVYIFFHLKEKKVIKLGFDHTTHNSASFTNPVVHILQVMKPIWITISTTVYLCLFYKRVKLLLWKEGTKTWKLFMFMSNIILHQNAHNSWGGIIVLLTNAMYPKLITHSLKTIQKTVNATYESVHYST